ncbi:MAG: hypothetical protein WBM86_21530 [Waterburya sp.]
MSDNHKSYEKSLEKANQFFWFGCISSIAGFVFFFGLLAFIKSVNTNNPSLSNLETKFTNVDTKLHNVITKLTSYETTSHDIVSELNNLKDQSSNFEKINNNQLDIEIKYLNSYNKEIRDILSELNNSKTELIQLNTQVQKTLVTFNNNSFLFVSLLGGLFLEIIAVINFYQYGKVLTKDPESIDRNQVFSQLNSLYNKSNEPSEKKEIRDLMANIMPNKQFDSKDKEDSESEDRNGNDKSSDSNSVTSNETT